MQSTANTWKAVMLDGSIRQFPIVRDKAGYGWQSAAGIWHVASSPHEALANLSLHLAQQGGYRELIPLAEPTRAELTQALGAINPLLTAARDHQAAQKRLNTLAQQGVTLSFDHPDVKALAVAGGRLNSVVEDFNRSRSADEISPPATMEYRNHQGEVRKRRIVPTLVWHGTTEWHPEAQWLLRAYDLDKNAQRDFAMREIREWSNTR